MNLNQILGTEFPIIQGGMANVATGAFAADMSNAGILGTIGTGAMDGETVRKHVRTAKARTKKPFAVNIMLMNPDADAIARVCVEEGVSVVTTGAGNPGKYIDQWKDAGIKVFPVVSSVALARRLERLGVDGIIAEGCESGGHIGELTTMVLLPQVADAVNVPVIGAGGIATGRQLRAAEILGACGAQVGTCLLVSEECPIHENYKAEVLKARDNSTIVTGRIGASPVRALKNPMARQYVKREKEGAGFEELERYTLGALRRAVLEGDTRNGSLMAGQVSAMVHEILPARTIIERIMKEYEELG